MTDPPRRTAPGDDTTWIRSPDVLFRRVPDGVVVLRLAERDAEVITGPGGVLWDLLAVPRTAADLTDELAARYDHDTTVIRRDLDAALEALHERHLVTPAP